MPIGKNALQRVANNGYAKLKSTAPDMENSVVIETPIVEEPKKRAAKKAVESVPAPKKTAEKKVAAAKKPVEKKVEAKPVEEKKAAAQKPATAKKTVAKKPAPKAKAQAEVAVGKKPEAAIQVGGALPYYLL